MEMIGGDGEIKELLPIFKHCSLQPLQQSDLA